MKVETLSIHGGYSPDPTTKAVAVPIYQTASYAFDNTQHGADLFDLKVAGNIYTRLMNPTTDVLEKRITALEGGVAGLAVASGMSAISYAVEALAHTGDNIIASSNLYGGTYTYFTQALALRGVSVRFIDPNKPEEILSVADERTKLVFCESIGNPSINVADLPRLADYAHQVGVPLVVDNTVASPVLCQPIKLGADIVVHSLTKYIGGHGTSLGGIIVDGGHFDWLAHAERFPALTQADPSYHGINYAKDCAPAAFATYLRVVSLRNTGAAISPMNAFLILQGLETLPLRMERHTENALKVAEFLQQHPQVEWVNYPGLQNSPFKDIIERDFANRASGLLSFGIQGGRENAAKFIDGLNIFTRLVNIGDAKSLACNPATTTHRQLNDEELTQAGVKPEMIRLSVGIENIDDLLEDLAQAFEQAK